MNVEPLLPVRFKLMQKAQILATSMAPMCFANDLASGDVRRHELASHRADILQPKA